MNPQNILVWLNFFAADVRDGLGPFLGVFLLQKGFDEAQIGVIGTIATLGALIFGVPLGILVDKTPFKRLLLGIGLGIITISTLLLWSFNNYIFTFISQFSIAIAAALLAPAFAALTLGIVGTKNYKFQVARNEAYKHGGTLFGAGLSFVFALYYGIGSIFIITILMGVCSILVLMLIKASSIDDAVACGATKSDVNENNKISLFSVLRNKAVLILAFVSFCFHLSNAYMLPLLSQRAHALGLDSSGAYAAATIIIAQATMIFISLWCMRLMRQFNGAKICFWLMGLSLFELMLRGLIAANSAQISAMVIVQILDGVGAGLTGVIVPILIAIILRGSGYINAGLAFIATTSGVGAALSASFGGVIAKHLSYFWAYSFLGLVALVGLVVWLMSYKRFIKFSV